jgi:AcrR family transcriptional regulator
MVARAMLAEASITVEDVAKRLGVSPATLYRHLPAARAQATTNGKGEG